MAHMTNILHLNMIKLDGSRCISQRLWIQTGSKHHSVVSHAHGLRDSYVLRTPVASGKGGLMLVRVPSSYRQLS